MTSRFDSIPGYREAVEHENVVRAAAFIDAPEELCGLAVRPLTLGDMVALEQCGVCFFNARQPFEPADVVRFLWYQHEGYRQSARFRRDLFIRQHARKANELCAGMITAWIDEAFQDSPGSSGGNEISYWHYSAGIIDMMGREYGWTIKDTMGAPLKVLFQLMKIINKRADPKAPAFNPSDRVKGQWLAELNRSMAN